MRIPLKPLHQQVMVITGATSGIGLTTARMAAAAGVRIVAAARNEDALRRLDEEFSVRRRACATVVADVSHPEEIERIAQIALERFGGFDTWVNNAGVSVFGKLLDTPVADQRQLFETDYWGVVHGSLTAARHLRKAGGGAIINIGSVASDFSLPEQGAYSAAKHAVLGFSDALRMELMQDKALVAVTVIKPGSIDTPFREHARNYMDKPARVPPPVYAPELVAKAILHAATHPTRDMVVGGGGRLYSAMQRLAPSLTDRIMVRTMGPQQRTDVPPRTTHDSLYQAGQDGYERSNWQGHVIESSLYTAAMRHPLLTAAAAVGVGAVAAALVGANRR